MVRSCGLEFAREQGVIQAAEKSLSNGLGKFAKLGPRLDCRFELPDLDVSESRLFEVKRKQARRHGPRMGRVDVEVGCEDREAFRVRRLEGDQSSGGDLRRE